MIEKLNPDIEKQTVYEEELDLSTLPIVSQTRKENEGFVKIRCYSQSYQFCPRCKQKNSCVSVLNPNS